MARSIWKGMLSVGLLNIPIKVSSAVREQDISFNQMCACGAKISLKRVCSKEGKEVPFSEIKKGYEIGKNKYLIFEKDEIESLKTKSNKTVEIEKFIDRADMDFLTIEKNYYIYPDELGIKAYSLLQQALSVLGKIAVGRINLRSKETPCLISAYKNTILLSLMYYTDEIVPIEEIKGAQVKETEFKLAEQLIGQFSGKLELAAFKDTYREILQNYIMAKAEGKIFEMQQIQEQKPTDSLEEALKKSLAIKQ